MAERITCGDSDMRHSFTVIGIAASGTTPYVIGALKAARENGCLTASISSNPDSPMSQVAEVPIEMVVGPSPPAISAVFSGAHRSEPMRLSYPRSIALPPNRPMT